MAWPLLAVLGQVYSENQDRIKSDQKDARSMQFGQKWELFKVTDRETISINDNRRSCMLCIETIGSFLRALQELVGPQSCRFEGVKLQAHLKDLFKEHANGVLYSQGVSKDGFSWIQLPRHSEASVAIVQGSPPTAQAGSRSWHCLHSASFAGMESARVIGHGGFLQDSREMFVGPGDMKSF